MSTTRKNRRNADFGGIWERAPRQTKQTQLRLQKRQPLRRVFAMNPTAVLRQTIYVSWDLANILLAGLYRTNCICPPFQKARRLHEGATYEQLHRPLSFAPHCEWTLVLARTRMQCTHYLVAWNSAKGTFFSRLRSWTSISLVIGPIHQFRPVRQLHSQEFR